MIFLILKRSAVFCGLGIDKINVICYTHSINNDFLEDTMTLRTRTNLARRLNPVYIPTMGNGKTVWGMRTLSDQAKNVEVIVNKSKKITYLPGEKVQHGLYDCQVLRVNKFNEVERYFGPHMLEYAIASIMAEAKKAKRQVIFYKDLKSVTLKRKIQNVSMIEIKCGKDTIWAVVSNVQN